MDQHELYPIQLSESDLENMPDSKDAKKWPKMLSELVDVLEAFNLREGMSEEPALDLASRTVFEIAQYHGGKQFYLPTGKILKIALRDRKIFAQMGKKSVEQLAKEHGLTTSRIYFIIQEQTTLMRNKIQTSLF